MAVRKFSLRQLFQLHSQGGLTLDQKLAVLEHYDITFPRRELARSIADVIEEKVDAAKRTNYSQAIAEATAEDLEKAAARVIDKYMMEAEGRFIVAQKEKAVLQEMAQKYTTKEAEEKAALVLYRWQSVTGDDRRCPDCVERHGQLKPMLAWKQLGIPRAGATVCRNYCRCSLIAVPGSEEDRKGRPEIPE